MNKDNAPDHEDFKNEVHDDCLDSKIPKHKVGLSVIEAELERATLTTSAFMKCSVVSF